MKNKQQISHNSLCTHTTPQAQIDVIEYSCWWVETEMLLSATDWGRVQVLCDLHRQEDEQMSDPLITSLTTCQGSDTGQREFERQVYATR